MNTITVQDGTGDTTVPDLVVGYETTREARTLIHDTLDGGIAVSLIPPRPRSGTLRLFYRSETAAKAAMDLHGRETSFGLESTERPTIDMSYVVTGSVRVALDEATLDRWTVDVGYQEIAP